MKAKASETTAPTETAQQRQPLTFARFREVNKKRCNEAFKPLDSWSLFDWYIAIAGEVGEMLNIVKKIRREFDHSPSPAEVLELTDEMPGSEVGTGTRADRVMDLCWLLRYELADIIIYCDLFLERADPGLTITEIFTFKPEGFAPIIEQCVEFDRSKAPMARLKAKRDIQIADVCMALSQALGRMVGSLCGQCDVGRVAVWAGSLIGIVVQLAHYLKIDIEQAVIEKFNIVSERRGSDIRL